MLNRTLIVVLGLSSVTALCVAQSSTRNCVEGPTTRTDGTSLANKAANVQDTAAGGKHTTIANAHSHSNLCGLPAGSSHPGAYAAASADAWSEQRLSEYTIDDAGSVANLVDPKVTGESSIAGAPSEQASSVQSFHVSANFAGSEDLPSAPSSLSRDAVHGRIYGLVGSTQAVSDLTAPTSLPLSQFGGEIGGGFEQGRSSYFVSYDQLDINRRQLLSQLAERIGTGNAAVLADANNLLSSAFAARVDHQFSTRDSAYLTYTRDKMSGNSLAAGGNAVLPSSATGLNTTQQTLTGINAIDLSPNTVNQSSGEFLSTSAEVPAGAQMVGVQSSLPSRQVLHVLQAADNIYRQVGGQSLRMGGDFISSQMSLSFLENGMGRTGNPSLSQSSRDTGAFIQQARQLRPNLLLTAGAGYDAQFIPGINNDLNNFSPQVGFAWSPNSSRTVLRGGFGMDYDRTPLPTFAGSVDSAVPTNLSRSAHFVNPGPSSFGSFASFTTVPAGIQSAYAEHSDFEAEQQLPARIVLTAQYQSVRGVQLPLPVYHSNSLCATTAACNSGNEFTGQEIGTGALSSYNGIDVALTQTPVHWGSYKMSYTYSTAHTAGSGSNLSSIDDEMHRVSFTGVLHSSLDPGTTLWQRLTHGFFLTGTSDYLNRQEFAGLNFIDLNGRLTKDLVVGPRFRLQTVVQTFNMFQRTNDTFAKTVAAFGDKTGTFFSTYTRVAEAQMPNSTNAGLRLTF